MKREMRNWRWDEARYCTYSTGYGTVRYGVPGTVRCVACANKKIVEIQIRTYTWTEIF
jgi:ppGpp synthetase/RelA/SpoT-type nucleotidyltranferase